MKRIICIGEDRAADSLHNYGVGERAIWDKNLPINDSKFRSMLTFGFPRYDLIVWSIGHPLLGCRGVETLRRMSALPPERRFFDYLGAGIWRNFDEGNYWQSLSPLDVNFMFAFWSEILNYILQTWGDKLIIYPWSVAWWENKLNLPISAVEILAETAGQLIDLSALPPEIYNSESPVIPPEGFQVLAPRFEALKN